MKSIYKSHGLINDLQINFRGIERWKKQSIALTAMK